MEDNLRSYRTTFFEKSDIFPDGLEKMDNANEAINIPIEVKNNIKRMVKEQVLYAQVVKLRRNYLKFTASNKNKSDAKSKFQVQSARSQRWFDLDFDLIEANNITRESDFYKKLFQIHNNTHDTNTFKSFQFPIGNSKCVEFFKFHNDAPMLKYCQKLLNSCFLRSLES